MDQNMAVLTPVFEPPQPGADDWYEYLVTELDNELSVRGATDLLDQMAIVAKMIGKRLDRLHPAIQADAYAWARDLIEGQIAPATAAPVTPVAAPSASPPAVTITYSVETRIEGDVRAIDLSFAQRMKRWLVQFMHWCVKTPSRPAVLKPAERPSPDRTAIVPCLLDLLLWRIPMNTSYKMALGAAASAFLFTPVNKEGQAIEATFDAQPTLTAGATVVNASIAGQIITVSPVAVGSDTVTVTGSIAGVSYTAIATFTVEDNVVADVSIIPDPTTAAATAAPAAAAPAAAA